MHPTWYGAATRIQPHMAFAWTWSGFVSFYPVRFYLLGFNVDPDLTLKSGVIKVYITLLSHMIRHRCS